MIKPKFKPEITRVKLNPEQAVLTCDCYQGQRGYTFISLHLPSDPLPEGVYDPGGYGTYCSYGAIVYLDEPKATEMTRYYQNSAGSS